jgi:hypothetical protein
LFKSGVTGQQHVAQSAKIDLYSATRLWDALTVAQSIQRVLPRNQLYFCICG